VLDKRRAVCIIKRRRGEERKINIGGIDVKITYQGEVYNAMPAKQKAKELVEQGYANVLFVLRQIVEEGGRMRKEELLKKLSKCTIHRLTNYFVIDEDNGYYVITDYGVKVAKALRLSQTPTCKKCGREGYFDHVYLDGDTVKGECFLCVHKDVLLRMRKETKPVIMAETHKRDKPRIGTPLSGWEDFDKELRASINGEDVEGLVDFDEGYALFELNNKYAKRTQERGEANIGIAILGNAIFAYEENPEVFRREYLRSAGVNPELYDLSSALYLVNWTFFRRK